MRRIEKTEDTRRKLLAAARRVFLRLGFHNSSLDQVAEEAGFTKGVVYSRFASKADLFLAILEERIDQRIVEMRTAVAALEGLLAVATVLSRQWDERLRQDEQWSLLLIEFRLHAARNPALNQRYAALQFLQRVFVLCDIHCAQALKVLVKCTESKPVRPLFSLFLSS